jgi:hypothetical protein
MKHSFFALSIFATAFTVTFVACSKKDWLDQKTQNPAGTILTAPTDASGVNNNTSGIKILPTAKGDTPYGKVNNPILAEPGIKIIPTAKGDTPYGKINIPLPAFDEPGIRIIPTAKDDTPYSRTRTTVIKPLE